MQFSLQLHHIQIEDMYRVELCTELFYAIIPTLLPCYLLSLQLVTFVMFFFFKSCSNIDILCAKIFPSPFRDRVLLGSFTV